ncbi:MAG: maleylacetoacetate isomerase [Rhodospirillaceae bacterium]|jgi:maleylacetoacetate isomerase/maleylpyruvate isomerase|nr:maleylacetoacetate isomerase [Rhodospirillaceae bacterium]MBT4773166.1 maleylacetoacetate isomerase [Rhodospirillaceae bacterium]MBT5358346.1 maleylacetoacetate isomerase [Rhodospirillaceae bacterium]MBT5771096.1 maleylacetoacetate isomerase [Rhodospirillaceae bacterium]MBT6308728.1 maleylacetoacetate isomerase [Rhodospirillaceae bacterium]
MKLFGYWRSLAAFRVRIALNLKGQAFEVVSTDLIKGEQFDPEYLKINPQGVVPALVTDDGTTLTQSMAILEYLDEVYPEPALLPADAAARARVRALCMILVADMHPLVVPRIRKYVTQDLGHSEEELGAWIGNWTTKGLEAIEKHLAEDGHSGTYCEGDQVTMADLCLVPQIGAAVLFKIPLDAYPNCQRIFKSCMELPAFFDARPQAQPDFPEEMK